MSAVKQGYGIPTIPTTTDESQWLQTDIHEFEHYEDLITNTIWTRNGNTFHIVKCCPKKAIVTLNKSQINNLHLNPVELIVPPANYGVKLVYSPQKEVFMDGVQFVFASGQYVNLVNGANVLSLVSQFSDPCVTEEGTFQGSYWHTYQSVKDNQQNATLRVMSDFPITGGGDNCFMRFTLWYFLV